MINIFDYLKKSETKKETTKEVNYNGRHVITKTTTTTIIYNEVPKELLNQIIQLKGDK